MSTLKGLHQKIRALGTDYNIETILAGLDLLAPLHEKQTFSEYSVQRDLSYGQHERHVLDIYHKKNQLEKRPVLVFVHGGGFVGGDKHRPDSPYNDNIGAWSVQNNMIGIVINYRLAPEFKYPAGAEDVNQALAWIHSQIQGFGGNPDQIIVLGTSAGANHVATCIARPELQNSSLIKAGILMSCIFDTTIAETNDHFLAYFGEDKKSYRSKSNLSGVAESDIPLLFTLAEYEPLDFARQALNFINTYFDKHNKWPNFLRIMNHNHFTSTQHIGTEDNEFGKQLVDFIGKSLAE